MQRKKAEAKQQAKREAYLRTLAADFDQCWRIADKHAARGIASAYDEVKRSLADLSDAHALCATQADFDQKLVQFMARHEKRSASAPRRCGSLEEVIAMKKSKTKKTAKFVAKSLDKLIEEATTDAYDESEQVGGFFAMTEENLSLPLTTWALGQAVTVTKVDLTGRDQIVTICVLGKAT